MSTDRFEITARDGGSSARVGIIHTESGDVCTPAFAPVGTLGAVKGLPPRDLTDLGVSVVMCNAYHLAMRPGIDTVVALGGLHRLSGWNGPLMTDSGGFQVFSLEGRRSVDEDGVTFQSHVDGATHRFTPESVIAAQQALGADLIMPLDVCTGYPVEKSVAEQEMELTHAWAVRARAAHDRRADQLLYGIVQGSVYPDLRAASARALVEAGFEAYAVGGVSVGEPKVDMMAALEAAVPNLPAFAPRHLLGVGHPEDIVEAVARGIDTFDCVAPTRWARTGAAITMAGRINLRNVAYSRDERPLAQNCDCYACSLFSRAAIRHFVKAGEILGLQLLTLHNLKFVLRLVADIRRAIEDGTFSLFREEFLATYAEGRHLRDDGEPTVGGGASPS